MSKKSKRDCETGYECFHCGHNTVIWQSDFSFEDYMVEGEGIVHVLHCAADIEYFVRLEETDEDL